MTWPVQVEVAIPMGDSRNRSDSLTPGGRECPDFCV